MTLYLYKTGTAAPALVIENAVSYTADRVITENGAVYGPFAEDCELSGLPDCSEALRARWRREHCLEDYPELMTLEERRAAKLRELSDACGAAVTAGCDVALSLGAGHIPLTAEHQINLPAATAAVEPGEELLFGEGEKLPHLGEAKAVFLEPLDLQKQGQLLLTVVSVAVLPHRLRTEKPQRVIMPQHPARHPAQPGKFTDGQHDIPPSFLLGTGSCGYPTPYHSGKVKKNFPRFTIPWKYSIITLPNLSKRGIPNVIFYSYITKRI